MTGGTASVMPVVTATQIASIATAAGNLKAGMTVDGWTWSVYSRTDNAMVSVTDGWMDNAPDIQRRRETPATSRTTFT